MSSALPVAAPSTGRGESRFAIGGSADGALPQPILVAADVLLHPPISFEDERARHDVIDEGAIVADEQQRARPVDEVRLEQLERFDVEIVGRLVEDEHVRRPRQQPREQKPVAFAAGERLHRRIRALGRKQKIAQVAVDVLRPAIHGHRIVAFADGVEHRALGVELFALLVVVGDLHVRAAPHLA